AEADLVADQGAAGVVAVHRTAAAGGNDVIGDETRTAVGKDAQAVAAIGEGVRSGAVSADQIVLKCQTGKVATHTNPSVQVRRNEIALRQIRTTNATTVIATHAN